MVRWLNDLGHANVIRMNPYGHTEVIRMNPYGHAGAGRMNPYGDAGAGQITPHGHARLEQINAHVRTDVRSGPEPDEARTSRVGAVPALRYVSLMFLPLLLAWMPLSVWAAKTPTLSAIVDEVRPSGRNVSTRDDAVRPLPLNVSTMTEGAGPQPLNVSARPEAARPLPVEVSTNTGAAGPLPGDGDVLHLAPGESRVLGAPGVRRVAVGHGERLHAVVLDKKEVLLFARSPGTTSLHVWMASGARKDYQVDVEESGTRRMHEELRALLGSIKRARSVRVGNKIVIEGQDLSDADRARVAVLAERYPEVVDFTSSVGWEPMVMFDVQVVEVPRYRLQELGVRWNGATQGGFNIGASWDAAGGRDVMQRAGESPIARPGTHAPLSGYLGANMLLASRIHALVESGEALVLAQPQLLARSGATADFLAGGEVPYTTVDEKGKSNTVFKPYGVSLQMTPRVERNGVIRAHLSVEASAVDTTVAGTNGPALRTRRASTEFNVQSGRTLVLAGFLSHEKSIRRDGLPGLSGLPLIGRLFGSHHDERRDVELAIFVTPSIVTQDNPDLLDRVDRARQLVDQSTGAAPVLNTRVRPDVPSGLTEHPYSSGRPLADTWPPDPYEDSTFFDGSGSQWDLDPRAQHREGER